MMYSVRKMLYLYTQIPERIAGRLDEIKYLESALRSARDTLKPQRITGMVVSGGGISDPTYDAVRRIVDDVERRMSKLEQDIKNYLLVQFQVEEAVSDLTLEEQHIIDLRYGVAFGFGRIAKELKYSRRQCYRIHDEAFVKVSKVIDKLREGEGI